MDCQGIMKNFGAEKNEENINEEYATQFFGFTPQSLVDGVRNALVEYIEEGTAALEEVLQANFGASMKAEEISEGTLHASQSAVQAMEKPFLKLQNYVTKTLVHIPSNIVLPEDRPQEKRYTEEEERAVEEEMEALKTRIKAAKYMTASLQGELAGIEQVLQRQGQLKNALECVNREHGADDCRNQVLLVNSQISNLLAKVQELQPYLTKFRSGRKRLTPSGREELMAKRLRKKD